MAIALAPPAVPCRIIYFGFSPSLPGKKLVLGMEITLGSSGICFPRSSTLLVLRSLYQRSKLHKNGVLPDRSPQYKQDEDDHDCQPDEHYCGAGIVEPPFDCGALADASSSALMCNRNPSLSRRLSRSAGSTTPSTS